MSSHHSIDPTVRFIDAAGVRLAYRTFGGAEGVPLVLLNRFRGTLDTWDPALLAALAAQRRVVVFDSAGVGRSAGETPSTVAGMAALAGAFIDALGYDRVDVLGWSLGGAVAQRLALDRPGLVRRLVLAATGPGGVPEAPRMPERVLEVMRKPDNDDDDFLYLFFHDSPTSRAAGADHLRRLRRGEHAGPAVRPESWRSQLAAIGAWTVGKDSAYPRLAELRQPTLVANGAHDVMIDPYNAYATARRIADARLVLYPDSGHGFLFQHIDAFARDVLTFLAD